MKRVVLSLGGSLVVPGEVDYEFLSSFKKCLDSISDFQFIVVVGGGKTARTYIDPLLKVKKSFMASEMGIDVCRLNALFLMRFFYGKEIHKIPHTLKDIKNALKKNRILFISDVGFLEHNTSDGTAAFIAHHLECNFINMTNVDGFYTKDPKKYKDAKFVSNITYDNFLSFINNMEYKPGQHFVLDQNAANIIKKYKIKTYIVGKDLKNLKNVLYNKSFKGTLISESCHC